MLQKYEGLSIVIRFRSLRKIMAKKKKIGRTYTNYILFKLCKLLRILDKNQIYCRSYMASIILTFSSQHQNAKNLA